MSANTDRHENAVARYFEAWNAAEPQALAKAVAAAWSVEGTYTDPLAAVTGHAEIAELIAGRTRSSRDSSSAPWEPSTGTTTPRASPGSW